MHLSLFVVELQPSQNNIYAALRTIDLTGSAGNTHPSPLFSTPTKQHLLSQPIPSRSPSIPYRSPVPSPLAQTPTHGRSALGTLH